MGKRGSRRHFLAPLQQCVLVCLEQQVLYFFATHRAVPISTPTNVAALRFTSLFDAFDLGCREETQRFLRYLTAMVSSLPETGVYRASTMGSLPKFDAFKSMRADASPSLKRAVTSTASSFARLIRQSGKRPSS